MGKKVLLENHFELVVADNETLGRWHGAVVLSTAFTHGDLRKPYTVQELVQQRTFFQKFDVVEQVKMGREVEQNVIDWWKSDKVTRKAREMSFFPDKNRDTSVTTFVDNYEKWAHRLGYEPVKSIHADRNLFDISKLQHIIEISLKEKHHPWNYHDIIDVTSYLKALCGDRYGNLDIRKMEGVVYHDPRYDSAVDWLRVQKVASELGLIKIEPRTQSEDLINFDDDIPF